MYVTPRRKIPDAVVVTPKASKKARLNGTIGVEKAQEGAHARTGQRWVRASLRC